MIYDADCALCDGTISFILKHEVAPVLQFVAGRSEAAASLYAAHDIAASVIDDTVIVICDGRAHYESDAAIIIAGQLRPPWRYLRWVRFVPGPLRNWAYRCVAKNRYRLFGRLDQCRIIDPDIAWRFPALSSGVSPS